MAQGRLIWRVATVAAIREESVSARSLTFQVDGWPGHLPGQHVDIKLTAPDGYSAQRSYSVASAWDPQQSSLEVTVQRVPRGELSPYLCDTAEIGDQAEIRGPVGGYFVWDHAKTDPVLLIAGGSGIVPLMAMIRARAQQRSRVPFRLVYSTRDPDSLIYGEELARRVRDDQGLDVTTVYTRETPPGWPVPPGRLTAAVLTQAGWPPELEPACFVCGPTGFVEATATMLVDAGHDPARVRTERFGPTS